VAFAFEHDIELPGSIEYELFLECLKI